MKTTPIVLATLALAACGGGTQSSTPIDFDGTPMAAPSGAAPQFIVSDDKKTAQMTLFGNPVVIDIGSLHPLDGMRNFSFDNFVDSMKRGDMEMVQHELNTLHELQQALQSTEQRLSDLQTNTIRQVQQHIDQP